MIEKLIPSLNPKIGLSMIAKILPERVGHPVQQYEMRFFIDDNRLDFLVYMPKDYFDNLKTDSISEQKLYAKYNNENHLHLYKYEQGEKIIKISLNLIKTKLPKDYVLHYVIIKYDEKLPTVIVDCYGTLNNEKLKQTFEL